MKIRPNDSKELTTTKDKNDLYIKFRVPFDRILNKDFDEFGAYNDKAYVSVDKSLENDIISFFDDCIDGIYPLIGSTGIGKTHLIMHILKQYYNDENIKANNVFIKEVGIDEYDIVLCSAHEKYNNSILSDLTRLLFCRVSTVNQKIQNNFHLKEMSTDTLESYVQDLKGEILFYKDEPKEYAIQTMYLKYLLSESGIKFRNFVLIYDDLESLNGESQHILIRDLLALYECLRNRKDNTHKTLLKFIFCLRTTTYSNLALRADYDTHRVKKPLLLNHFPSLGELFESRFNLCVTHYNLLQEAGNKKTWLAAKKILMDLSQRLDICSKDLLIKMNNYNISDALEDFAKILTNRKWTQKNKNLRQSFKISEEEYYINNINIFRVLFMGESDVYVNNTLYNYPTIFLEGQNRKQDFWCLYILLFFSRRYKKFLRTNSYNHLSINDDEAIDIFCNIFLEEESNTNIRRMIKRIIGKMIEYKLLEKDSFPRDKEVTEKQFYITPEGNTIFEEFFKSNILFGIFRDELALDQDKYNIRCTCNLTQEEVNEEFFKYIQEFWSIEKDYFSNILSSQAKMDDYMEYFGESLISQKMLSALKEGINTFYKNDLSENLRVKNLLKLMEEFSQEISSKINF